MPILTCFDLKDLPGFTDDAGVDSVATDLTRAVAVLNPISGNEGDVSVFLSCNSRSFSLLMSILVSIQEASTVQGCIEGFWFRQ